MGEYAEVGSAILLFFLVFGMSATVDISHLCKQLRNRNAILIGISLQFIILPLLGFMVVRVLGLIAPIGITLLVVTSSPGGSYSNWWCSLFNADLALSVTMTTISTLLSVVMLPVNLIIYATGSYSSAVVKSLDWPALFHSLITVIGGIGSGLLCSACVKSHKFNLWANKLGNVAGISLVAYSVVVSTGDQNANIWDQSPAFYIGVALPCMLGLIIASSMATYFRLEKPERVAVAVECCYQNTGIATSIALNMFEGDDLAVAVGVPLFYGICEAVLLAIYCLGAWKAGWTKAPHDENICVVIYTSYEVQEATLQDPDAIEVVLGLPKDGGEPSDLIFATTQDGYQIDEESLGSLSTGGSSTEQVDTTQSSANVEEHVAEETLAREQEPVNDDRPSSPEPSSTSPPEASAGARRRKKAYSALECTSPVKDRTAIASPPRALSVPLEDEKDRTASVSSTGSNRLGMAVATLRSRVPGTKRYTKATSEGVAEAEDETDEQNFNFPSLSPTEARISQSQDEAGPPIPATDKTID